MSSVSNVPRSGAPAILALTLLLLTSALAGLTVATERPAAAAPSPSLSVSPKSYVGGQRLTWTGNVGHAGERRLVLQFNMGSAVGNTWNTVEGFSSRTQRDGSFTFTYPAPSMFNIRYRVKAGRYVSPARVFEAKTQDLTIRVTGQRENNTNEPGRVSVGEPFGITVDTTPDSIYRSPESQGLPVYAGRVLTLQKRLDGDTWITLGTTKVTSNGSGSFSNLVEKAGVSVYRVRQENHLADGNRIGWTQSFPLHVLVGEEAQRWYSNRYGSNQRSAEEPLERRTVGRQPETASLNHRWVPSLFDFAWEHGQSLDSLPARGTRIQGHWVDYSDGSGRVSKYNGGLALDSKRYTGAGAGDFGTTRATMVGNAMLQGRWETSLRVRNSFERDETDYKILAELVPAAGADNPCLHTITIASISPFSRQVRYGVKSSTQRWAGSTTAPDVPLANPYNVAVEVSSSHITWFLNGAPVGSVTSTNAIPRVPMTLRLSLVGSGDSEMNQTGLISDWQRGFPITTGSKTVSPKKLARQDAVVPGCA